MKIKFYEFESWSCDDRSLSGLTMARIYKHPGDLFKFTQARKAEDFVRDLIFKLIIQNNKEDKS